MAIDLDHLEAVARAATPGPWHAEADAGGGRHRGRVYETSIIECLAVVYCGGGNVGHGLDNATHIATFDPPTVLEMLAMVREGHFRLGKMRERIAELDAQVAELRAELTVEQQKGKL